MEKLKRYAKKLYDRFTRGAYGQQSEEVEVAKNLFDKLIAKYGWDEVEFSRYGGVSAKIENFRLVFVPEMSYAKNPNWFKTLVRLLSVHFDSEVVLTYDRLGCVLIGQKDKVLAFRDDLEFAIARSKRTYELVCLHVSGGKPARVDYFLGFAVGYNQAKVEAKIAEQASQISENEKMDTVTLMTISVALANAEAEVNELKASGKIREDNSRQEIKDEAAYFLGYRDGLLSKKFLLT